MQTIRTLRSIMVITQYMSNTQSFDLLSVLLRWISML